MRILSVMTGLRCGDAERYGLTQLRGLHASGVEVQALCPDKGPLSRYCERLGVAPLTWRHCLPCDPSAVIRLASLIHSRRIDAVVSHQPNGALLASLASRLAHVPCLAFAHTAQAPGHYRYASLVVATSAILVRTFAGKEEGPPVHVIPPGIDLGELQPLTVEHAKLRCGFDASVTRVGVFGALTPDGQQDCVLRAWSQVVQSFPWARLMVVGDGPQRAALQTLANAYPLRGRVEFRSQADDLRQMLNACDLVVIPGQHGDVVTVALEAMGRARPVVATHRSLPVELQHERYSLLVPPARPDVLAEGMLTLMKNPTYSERLGQQARAYVAAHFTAEDLTHRTLQCLRQAGGQQAALTAVAR